MTHNRRGFFGRLAAFLAAPVASKLKPSADELDGYTADGPAEVDCYRFDNCTSHGGRSEFVTVFDDKVTPCPFVFKDKVCGYNGPVTSCGKTFKDCRSLDNHARFGGCQA